MKRYRVVLDRPNCIGAGSCVAVQPERWVMSKVDDKVDFIGSTEEEKGQFVLEIGEDELERYRETAQICPVIVIHIIDLQTGEKLI